MSNLILLDYFQTRSWLDNRLVPKEISVILVWLSVWMQNVDYFRVGQQRLNLVSTHLLQYSREVYLLHHLDPSARFSSVLVYPSKLALLFSFR
jgi:hypothetical protein